MAETYRKTERVSRKEKYQRRLKIPQNRTNSSKTKDYKKTKDLSKKKGLKRKKRGSETTTANIYLFRANNRNTRKRCEMCSNLTIKTPEQFTQSAGTLEQAVKYIQS